MEFFGRILTHLIQQHGRLEVSGLGSFYGEYAGAALQFATRTIVPPSFRIDFDARPTTGRENHFISFLVAETGMNETMAKTFVEEFSRNAVASLASSGRFEISGMGTLLKDIEGHIIFKSGGEQSLPSESFGLGKLQAETVFSKTGAVNKEAPVIPLHPFDEEIAEPIGNESGKRSGFRWFAAGGIAAAMIISAASVYFLSRQNGPVLSEIARQEANIVPLTSSSFSKPSVKISEAPVSPKSAKAAALPNATAEVAAERTQYRFFVIAGSFKLESKSEKLSIGLKKKGFDAKVLPRTESGQHRVSMGVFDKKEKALEFLNIQKADTQDQLWILKGEIQK
jgi:cell division septation protein DedD